MNDFFQKYKRDFWIVVLVFSLLLIFLIVRVVYSLNVVQAGFLLNENKTTTEKPDAVLWQNQEAQQLQKEIYWFEQQLALAKSDSISLGINLTDTVVQVQLKGTIIFQSKILKKEPVNFMRSLSEDAYLTFAKMNRINTETANIPKKPIKKVIAPKNESEVTEAKQDTIPEEKLTWSFQAGNNVNIIINGVEMNDDSLFVVNANSDILKYRTSEFFQRILPENYTPTLFLWLNDKEAKAIYRAFPEKGKVIFRN